MGVYDTLKVIGYRCPYCSGSTVDFQTKDTDARLGHFYVHEPGTHRRDGKLISNCIECSLTFDGRPEHVSVDESLKFVRAIGTCRSPECVAVAKANSVITLGNSFVGSRFFDVRFSVDSSHRWVSLPMKIVKKDGLNPKKVLSKFSFMYDSDMELQRQMEPAMKRTDKLMLALLSSSVSGVNVD